MDKGGGGGKSRFSVEKIFSHSAEKFRRATLLCSVSEIFRRGKSLWIKGGGNQEFASKKFSLPVPKNFAGESFTASLISGIGKC